MEKSRATVNVQEGNTELPDKSLVIFGYDVKGRVTSDSEPMKDVSFLLYGVRTFVFHFLLKLFFFVEAEKIVKFIDSNFVDFSIRISISSKFPLPGRRGQKLRHQSHQRFQTQKTFVPRVLRQNRSLHFPRNFLRKLLARAFLRRSQDQIRRSALETDLRSQPREPRLAPLQGHRFLRLWARAIFRNWKTPGKCGNFPRRKTGGGFGKRWKIRGGKYDRGELPVYGESW